MGLLFETIRANVIKGRYVVGQHAVERLDERGVLEWQIVDGIDQAIIVAERQQSQPNPSVEVVQSLADGSELKVIWSLMTRADVAKLVTVYFIDE